MSDKIIRSALEGRLATWAATQSLTIAYENVPFQQPTTTYLRAWMLPANRESLDLEGKHTLFMGIFQVDVVGVEGVGSGAVAAIVDLIDAQFPVNLTIVKSGLNVRVISPISTVRGEPEAGRYIVNVSIPYRCDKIT